MPLVSGTLLGPYEILAPVAGGGQGDVYKARDTRLNRTVALKVAKEQFSERFHREAEAVAALNHPHICTLYDVGPDYLVMEYVEGQPLKGPLPVERSIQSSAVHPGSADERSRHSGRALPESRFHRQRHPQHVGAGEGGVLNPLPAPGSL